jgi:hypothetical protein
MKRIVLLTVAIILFSGIRAGESRWKLAGHGAIEWVVDDRLPHDDHLEMSGQQLSVVLRYGVDADRAFHVNRAIMFPMLRQHPVTRTQAHLKQRIGLDIPKLITVSEMTPVAEKVTRISFDGILKVESVMDFQSGRNMVREGLALTRLHYPSSVSMYYIEEYVFENRGKNAITLRLPEINISYPVPHSEGLYGAYVVEVTISKTGWFTLEPGQELLFHALFSGRKADEPAFDRIDTATERSRRRALVREWWSKLVLETPDPVLDRMFAFAKLRAAESIYKTKGGFMHGPGGEAYYAAIWANDQAEYINPLFPFLGYGIGNESAINSFRHFARYMNDEYRPIPSSIISEGAHYWHGAGDRGDGAMIAYGAGRYALARGERSEAEELWPLIEWTLEYCRRKLTVDGVVASDSDELENRFPAGDANLCSSSLYYDALVSAALLGKQLGKPSSQVRGYHNQAVAMRRAIEAHFGATIEGFDTYRYYEGNDVLRSWICIPLTMGIYNRAAGTIAALFSPHLWSDDGLLTQAGTETFWDRSTLYALRGVLAAGTTGKGLEYLGKYSRRRLLGEHVPYAIEAWPEGSQRHLSAESGLYARIFTEGVFGIRPTGFRSFEMTPHLPSGWDFMNLRSVRAFGQDFDIEVRRIGEQTDVHVKNASGTVLKRQIDQGETVTVIFK